MDLVAHCGESTEEFYLNTLSTVDVATGWVECQGVWVKGQERVGGAVHQIGQRLPFPFLGLDSDNGGEFINHHLYAYCQSKKITFTRSRPYKKNDSAHVEQLNQVYGLICWHLNFFQPVMQLQRKTRHGAKVHKVYDAARTPYRRLLDSGVLAPQQQNDLALQYQRIKPVRLLSQINKAQEKLWMMGTITSGHQPSVTS